jgi:diguanylate cyclase (GGDEF)-like protein
MVGVSDAPNYDGSTDELVKLGYFAEMAKDIAAARTIRQTLDQIMRHVGEIFAPANWSILLRDRQTGDLRFTLITGSAVDSLTGKVVPRGRGIAGWIAENGMPLIVEDVTRDSRFDNSYDQIAEFETRSIIGVPLKTETEVFGVIELVNTLEERAFTPLDLKFLTTIADFGAIAIEKAYYLNALRRISSHDSLTGLLNRRSFERLYRRELERLGRTGRRFSVLIVDMDEFKAINDRWGHAEGDRALQRVATILKGETRKMDILARFGGDEFVVLLPETTQQQSQQIVKRIRNAISYASREVDYTLSASIGVREAAKDEADPLGLADQQMYEEKRRKQERTIDSLAENLEEFFEEEGDHRPGQRGE